MINPIKQRGAIIPYQNVVRDAANLEHALRSVVNEETRAKIEKVLSELSTSTYISNKDEEEPEDLYPLYLDQIQDWSGLS